METVTEQPIKKIEFFQCPQSLPGVAPLTKKPEDSGYEIVWILTTFRHCRVRFYAFFFFDNQFLQTAVYVAPVSISIS